MIERAIGCGLTWERSWSFLEEGASAEEARRCLGDPDEVERRVFNAAVVEHGVELAQSPGHFGPGPEEAFQLGLLRDGASYERWRWRRMEYVGWSWTDSLQVTYVLVVGAPEGESVVLRKKRAIPTTTPVV